MLAHDNIAIIRRWFEEVWNQGRLETIDELLAPGAVGHDILSHGSSIRGAADFRAAVEKIRAAFGELHFTVEDIFGAGDRIAVRLTARMRHTGPLGDLPATGKSATVPIMCIIQLRDGKLVEGWNFWDIGAPLRAANAPLERQTLL